MSSAQVLEKDVKDAKSAPPLTVGRTFQVLVRFFPLLRPLWPQLILLFLVLPLAGSVTSVVPALCNRMIIDVAFPRKSVKMLAAFGGMAVLMMLMERLLSVIVRNATSAHLRTRVIEGLGTRFYRNMLGLDLRYHQSTPVGEKIFRSDTDIIDTAELLGLAFPMTVQYLCQFLVTVLTICLIDWRPMAIAAACSPVFLLVAQQFFNYYRKVDARQRVEGEKLTAQVEQSLANVAVIYAHGARSHSRFQYYRALVRYSLANMLYWFLQQVSIVVVWPSGLPATMAGYLIGLCGYWVITGSMTLGQWQAIGLLIIQAIVPLGILLNYYQVIRLRMVPAERVLSLLDSEKRIGERPGTRPIEAGFRGDIEFKDVCFAYTPEKPVLRGVSFSIRAGRRVAFVGPSGIGKSTILNLLLRFYEPDDGQILVDGEDIRSYRLADYRRQFGIVLQSPVIFERTLRENILYGAHQETPPDLGPVIRGTGLTGVVAALPHGLDTPLCGDGSLSLGQKQCVTVARCMAGEPRLVLLDEPTSLGDPASKQAIVEGIDMAASGKTTVFISHDLLTLRNLDEIIVLNEGVVWERGTHAELLARGGLYHGLWTMQTQRRVDTPTPGEPAP